MHIADMQICILHKHAPRWQIRQMDASHRSIRAHAGPRTDDATQIREASTEVGAPVFSQRRIGGGLCVERSLPLRGRRVFTAYVSFNDEATFQRWCNSDFAALAHPHLQDRLRRAAQTAFSAIPSEPRT